MILAGSYLIFACHPFYELEPHLLFSIRLETHRFLNRTEILVLKIYNRIITDFHHSDTNHIMIVSFIRVKISNYLRISLFEKSIVVSDSLGFFVFFESVAGSSLLILSIEH